MIRSLSYPATLAACAILFACSQQPSDAQDNDDTMPPPDQAAMETGDSSDASYPSMMRAKGDILGDDGNAIGTVNMLEGPNGVMVEVNIEEGSLSEGWHGIHIHQTGDCSDTGEFKRSGGHVGKSTAAHGLYNPDGPEPGDLPNIYASENGAAHMQAFSTIISLSQVLDEDGGALVIHEDPDDHFTQPIGGAGARVACSVLE